MGQILGTMWTRDIDLKMNDQPTFSKTAGFTCKRNPRKMLVCDAYLKSAKIPIKYRDYCAHYLLDYQTCRYVNMPLVYRCHHEKHKYLNCEHEDYVIRMKEFEREKRLRLRELRLKSNRENKETDTEMDKKGDSC